MRYLAGVFAVWLVLSGPAAAQERGDGIEATISAQIDAFLADDFARAFTFASPSIRNLFGTPETFATMVRRGYPMVWRPSELAFGSQRAEAGAIWQRVVIRDGAGRVHDLDYQMIRTETGWKINAVQIVPGPGTGV